jgi:hypothetical protein
MSSQYADTFHTAFVNGLVYAIADFSIADIPSFYTLKPHQIEARSNNLEDRIQATTDLLSSHGRHTEEMVLRTSNPSRQGSTPLDKGAQFSHFDYSTLDTSVGAKPNKLLSAPSSQMPQSLPEMRREEERFMMRRENATTPRITSMGSTTTNTAADKQAVVLDQHATLLDVIEHWVRCASPPSTTLSNHQ